MPSTSKAQQRLMGVVRSIQTGQTPPDKASPKAREMAKNMSKKDVKDFASTPTKGLPDRVSEMATTDIHFKAILKMYDVGGGFTKKKISAVVSGTPHSTREKIINDLRDMGYQEIIDAERKLGIDEGSKKEGVGREIRPMIEEMIKECGTFREFVKEFTDRFNAYPKTKKSIQTLESVYNKHKIVSDQVQAQSGQEDLENDPTIYRNSPDKSTDDCGCGRTEQNIHTSNKLSLKTAANNL